MADYLLDWATANDNGTTTLTNGSESVNVTVSNPTNTAGNNAEAVAEVNPGGPSALLPDGYISEPVITDIRFDQAVENLSFTIYDVDAYAGSWDDKVTVIALDANGNQVDVIFGSVTGEQSVSGNSVEGENTTYSSFTGGDSVTVSIAGPIVSLQLVYDNGDDAANSGVIGYSDMSFDAAPVVSDEVVEGTAGDDLIDVAYTGDPEGDMIDAADNSAGNDDDVVVAGAGNDTVLAGNGDDLVYGGSGDDSLLGEAGNDTLIGDCGDALGTATITFEYEEAGYVNTLGVYYIDPDTGELVNPEIAFENASATGSGGDLIPGVSSYTYINIPPGATVGVFTITNGAGENDFAALGEGTYEFRDPVTGDIATVNTDSPVLVHVATDGTETVLDGDIYHTAGYDATVDLNADGTNHFVGMSENADGSATFGFEDLNVNGDPNYANDYDYDDPVFTVSLTGPDIGFANSDYTVTSDDSGSPVPGDDVIIGGVGDDLLIGCAGDDTIYGNEDDDTIYGNEGADVIYGGDNNDTVYGGSENDTITGGAGADSLDGGEEDKDLFLGGNEGDYVYGGSGVNTDYDTLDLTGAALAANPGGSLNIVYDADPEDGTVYFRDVDGKITGTMRFEEIEKVIPCFTPGTMIATPKGERPVESLQVGDKVITRDSGIQEIRWIGQRGLNGRELTRAPHLRPILVQKGALGNGLPERDMLVSPNHRMLVANDRTALYFDEHEVLVAAKHLVNHRGIQQLNSLSANYIHFMFDRHEVVLSDGAWTESFQPGDYTLKGMGNAQRTEIFEIFPELKTLKGLEDYTAARKTLKRHEAALLHEL